MILDAVTVLSHPFYFEKYWHNEIIIAVAVTFRDVTEVAIFLKPWFRVYVVLCLLLQEEEFQIS